MKMFIVVSILAFSISGTMFAQSKTVKLSTTVKVTYIARPSSGCTGDDVEKVGALCGNVGDPCCMHVSANAN